MGFLSWFAVWGSIWRRSVLSSLALRVGAELGEDFGWWDGEFGDEVFGDVCGGEAWSGRFGATKVPAFKVEAASEDEKHLLDVALEGADDVFAEEDLSAAVFAEHAAGSLGLVEELADLVDEGPGAAEVDGALPAVFAPGEALPDAVKAFA